MSAISSPPNSGLPSYAAPVNTLLASASAAALAANAVNGQAIAPASVASAGAVSGTTGAFNGQVTVATAQWGNASYAAYNGVLTETSTSSQLIPLVGRNLAGTSGTGYTTKGAGSGVYSGLEFGFDTIKLYLSTGVFTNGQAVSPVSKLTINSNGTVEVPGAISAASVASTGPIRPGVYTVAEANALTAAAAGAGAGIYVSNETGGAVPAFSDGSVWRRVTDRAVIV